VIRVKLIKKSLIIEKKSKFYGLLYEINSKEEIKLILDNLKQKYKNYRHMPYSYILNNEASKSNDKEPGNIGLGLYNILKNNNLNTHILIVVRIYGGVKLGASNLLRTYLNAANQTINK
jgi:putative IMPACT (imprinted ancient) family translation regulator